ncbi:MAG TPA: MC/SLC25 family protein, partial [Candidatus Nitrosotenuis sp.]|nr:MC/SLC25 family protein [Candidatus Nitrosotenuis sp.]
EKTWGGNQLVASLTYAAIDSFFITPIERIRILQITQPHQFKLSQLKFKMLPEMFQGTTLMFQQGFINCSTFLLLEKTFRTKAKEVNNNQELSWRHYVAIGTTISLIQTTLTHPLTTLRVRIQAQNPMPPHQQQKGMDSKFWEIVKNTGWRQLQAGWGLRFIRMAITATMDSYFLNYIEQRHVKSAESKN